MGRIFEVRKHTMFARWNRMAKQFAKIGKDITIAVKSGGTDPNSNPSLRRVIQNARAVNMPKDKVEAAIKRAGVDRVILCRCDSADAIGWGQSVGIRLFQGHYIDSRLRAARPPAIAAARHALRSNVAS